MGLQAVEFRERLEPLGREPDDLAASVGRRLFAGNQAGLGETRKDAAQIPGIQVEVAAQVRYRNIVAVSQLEQHASFRESERGAGEIGPQ